MGRSLGGFKMGSSDERGIMWFVVLVAVGYHIWIYVKLRIISKSQENLTCKIWDRFSPGSALLWISLAPMALLFASAVNHAIFENRSGVFISFFLQAAEAFLNTMFWGLLGLGVIIPILPVCLIYQLAYLSHLNKKREKIDYGGVQIIGEPKISKKNETEDKP